MSLTGVCLQYRLRANFLKPVPTTPMTKLTSLLLVAGLAVTALPSSLLAAPPTRSAAEPAAETEPVADPDQAKLSAAKRKVLALPDIASAQQQAKADRAMASKASAEYKQARTKAAESETAFRKAFDEALAKEDPAAAEIQKKQREAFREKMLKARSEKKPAAAKERADDEG
jgi:hypothetical protein